MTRTPRRWIPAAALSVVLLSATVGHAETSTTPPRLPGKVALDQKLDTQLPLDLMFRDESGRVVRLGQYFRRDRPVLLNFVYYNCPMLCPMALEGLTSSLTELKFDIGDQFDVVTVSIDPRDTPAMAAERKERYVKRYGRMSANTGWHFLTANESAIRKLADAVGFRYAYDIQANQFAHATVLIVLTPTGRVSRYLYGFEYKPRDLRLSLVEASANKIGTPTDALLLMCYHYDAATGKYGRSAMNFVRAGGVATVLGLAGFIFVMVRRERQENALAPAGLDSAPASAPPNQETTNRRDSARATFAPTDQDDHDA